MRTLNPLARVALTAAVLAVGTSSSRAVVVGSWVGGPAGDWGTPANWSSNPAIPSTLADVAIIDNATVTSYGPRSFAGLNLGPAATLNLGTISDPNITLIGSLIGGDNNFPIGDLGSEFSDARIGYALGGNITNNGVINVNPNTFVNPRGWMDFTGTGVMNVIAAAPSDHVFQSSNFGLPSAFRNERTHTIQGYGVIADALVAFQNEGTISANSAAGLTLTLQLGDRNAYNSGLLRAVDGGHLAITSTATGTVRTLRQFRGFGGDNSEPAGSIHAAPASSVFAQDLHFIAGNFTTAGDGAIQIYSSPGAHTILDSGAYSYRSSNVPRLDPRSIITVNGNVQLIGGSTEIRGHLLADGLTVGTPTSGAALLLTRQPGIYAGIEIMEQYNQPTNVLTLAGPGSVFPDIDLNGGFHYDYKPGSIRLSDRPDNVIAPNSTNGATVYVAPNFTISGAGTLVLPGHFAGNLVAHGTNPLILRSNAPGSTQFDYGATFTADPNSELDLVNAPGLTNGFSQFFQDPGTGKSTLLGGNSYHAKGFLAFPDTLDANGADLHLYPGGHFIKVGQPSYDAISELPVNGGTITFHDGVSLTTLNASSFTNWGTVTLAGDANNITYSAPVDGAGVFVIDGNNNTLTFAKAFLNNEIHVTGNNNTVNFTTQPLNTVPIKVLGASTFHVQAPNGPGGTLPLGDFTAAQGGTFVLHGATPSPVIPAGASYTLDGPTSKIVNENNANLLPAVTDVFGSLTLTNGATLPATHLHNAGHLTIGQGTSQTFSSLTQTTPGSLLTVDGSLTAPTIDIQQGTLNGYFNITGNLHLHAGATLDPGHSPAPTATVNGNLVLDPGATASMDAVSIVYNYDGTLLGWAIDPDNSDHVQVTGDLTVTGALLQINQLQGYDPYWGTPVDTYPYLGESLTLFTYTGTLTGQFANVIQPPNMPTGLGYVLHYTDHTITATVETLVPEPASLLAVCGLAPLLRRRRTKS